MRRGLSLVVSVLMTTALIGLGTAVTASADCGWPSCNPARMSANQYFREYPPNGYAANAQIAFNSSIAYPTYETWVSYSGTSDSNWLGCCPWNPDSNQLSDSWFVSGIAVSVYISWPPGIGFSGSGGGPSTYTTNTGANWRNHHNFSGIQFDGFDITSVGENACSDLHFSYDGEYHCTSNHWVYV